MPEFRKSLHWRDIACAAAVLALGQLGAAVDAQAQSADKAVSYPVVQPLPSRESLALNAALSRLGHNPRDLDALVDAGNAALALGDVDAAFGFFQRADQVASGNPQVKAGLAAAMVRKGDPVKAIALFEQAEWAGANRGELAADRGLAYDLVGDNAEAQRYYRLALEQGENEEVTRRLALSLAISGDREGFEQTLLPLLHKQDKAAWRMRAFGLAALGKTDGAVHITETMLPQKLADEIAPYLRYMPRLTRAQQAAAANLGDFPRASEIGRDDPRIAQLSSQASRRPAVAVAEPVREGVGAGAQSRSGGNKKSAKADKRSKNREEASRKSRAAAKEAVERTAPPEPQPARQLGAPSEPALAPAPKSAAAPAVAESQPKFAASKPDPIPSEGPSSQSAARPGFDLARMTNSQAGGVESSSSPPVLKPDETEDGSESHVSLAEAFGDIGKPKDNVVPSPGAVDIRKITPAKPKPPPPSHPSRIWVQLGIGRDKSALAFDWRRLTSKAPEQLKRQKAYVSTMGQTNRMLTGPFKSEADAKQFIRELHKVGISGPYVWTSPAGQVVDSLR